MHAVLSTTVDTFFEHLDAGRDWAATRVGLDFLEEVGPVRLVTELLRPVQQEVGLRWEHGQYTVAHEHTATNLVDELLSAALLRIQRPDEDRPTLLLACAEGDWHGGAARMAAVVARAAGWPVRFVGASTPAAEIARSLDPEQVLAVCVTCTLPGALGGVREVSDAVHAVGVPVAAGGSALAFLASTDELCVDVAGDDPRQLLASLEPWLDARPTIDHRPLLDEVVHERTWLAAARPQLLRAVRDAGQGSPAAFGRMLDVLDAAVLTGDAGLLTKHVVWWVSREDASRPADGEVARALTLAQEQVAPDLPVARQALAEAHRALGG